MIQYASIFDFIQGQEKAYRLPIPVNEKWDWSMRDHVLITELYTNSQLYNGKNDYTPVKNITRPILNLQHRTEDIEVKDVVIYVDQADKYHLSFLVKKYHDNVFAVENDLDTFFDDLNISRIDYGAGLSKQLNKPCPEVVPLQSIAFCDQTDMLSGPIGIQHFFSPDQLMDMKKVGWGSEKNGATASVEDLIKLSREEKQEDINTKSAKTPGRYIKVYEVHGNLPKRFVDENDDSEEYETRIFIVAFYQKKDSEDKGGIILYTAPEKESPFKIIKRDNVYGRALGFGGAEELFEAQVWTNYAVIREQNMLDAAAVTVMGVTGSDSQGITQRNKIQEMKNLEIIDLGTDGNLKQIDTFPRNRALFEKSINDWEQHAKDMGGAQDPIQGTPPNSGTPFASLQAQIQQAMGLHAYRRGIFAKHLEEIYRDWIIPHIEKKICEGTKFLAELSLEELQWVAGNIITNKVNQMVKEKILNGEIISQQEIDQYTQTLQQQFQKKGNKHFIEILKGEFKDVALGVKVSIAGKSKDLAGMVDKLTKVFQTIMANPYILKAPPIAKLFNQIIEASGLEPIDLSQLNIPPMPQRRLTERLDYKDLVTPPTPAQQEMLGLAGIQTQEMFGSKPAQPVTQ